MRGVIRLGVAVGLVLGCLLTGCTGGANVKVPAEGMGSPPANPTTGVRPVQSSTPSPSGTRITDALARVPVLTGEQLVDGYRRDQFGTGWTDTDGNGCNQRDDVLLRDAEPGTTLVAVQGSCDHDVLAGTWRDPYTGRLLTFTDLKDPQQSQAIQIDHVVSLSDAWRTGAWEWPREQRVVFANDLANLLAVDGPTNQAKGNSGPPEWLPEVDRCKYVERYVGVKADYGLGVTETDWKALRALLTDCER